MVARTYWRDGKYWYLNDDGRWDAYSADDLLTILDGPETGFFNHTIADQKAASAWKVAKFKAFKRRILTKNNINFVGEFAGHQMGITEGPGGRYLITRGPTMIKPVERDYKIIWDLLTDLLGEEQLPYFLAWLKTSYEALRDGEMSTGQMLVLAGPPGVGKSFIKEFIIRPILGGRHTDLTAYLQGKTHFNSDSSRAESWEIDDQVGVSDSQKRKMFNGAFKKLTSSNDHRTEAKGKDAIQPPPLFHRLTVYTNDYSYSLWVLPELDESTVGKAIILKAHKAENPRVQLPNVKERPDFRERFERALPGFVHMLTQWEIPEAITNGRYGVRAYQHPELKAALGHMSDEARLLEMIDILLPLSEPWEGTSGDLEIALRAYAKDSGMSQELSKVLWNRRALGNGLGKIRKTNPERVRLKGQNWKGKSVWILLPVEVKEGEEKPKGRKTEANYQR